MKALIFSGGDFSSIPDYLNINEYDITIACDGGFLSAKDSGITPDIFVGDFDSVPEDLVDCPEIIRLYPVKDMTDTQEAIDVAVTRGAKKIAILGALGGRIDHTLANIHLLKYAKEKGADVKIADTDTYISLVTDEAQIPKKDGFCLSLIPLTDCTGVCIKGVYYPLDNAYMPIGNPYGISNEFTEDKAQISLKSGELLVVLVKS